MIVTITDADRKVCPVCQSTITKWTSMHGQLGAWMCDGEQIKVVSPRGRRAYRAATPEQIETIRRANKEAK